MMERNVMDKKMVPPMHDEPLAMLRKSNNSSFVLGSIQTKKMPDTCRQVVNTVKLTMPCNSWLASASLDTSHIGNSKVEMAADRFKAELLKVVNIA